MALSPADRLATLSDPHCAALRQRFIDQGYTPEVIGAAERVAPGLFDALRLPLVRWELTRRPSPGVDLARLFAYSEALPRDRVDALLGAPLVDVLLSAGLLLLLPGTPENDRGFVAAGLQLLPFEGLYLAADEFAAGGDAVMGPGPTTAEIAQVVPRHVHGAVLDVGCGAGSLCLLAALRGAARAVGVDVNPRAVAVATFNARLNGLRAEFRAGDLMAPVHGERFDLVLAQPPFVTQPPDMVSTTYLHGGAAGDELALRLLSGVPGVLTPAGRAVVLFDTPVRAQSPVHARVRAALGGAAVDLVVLAAPGHTADRQAVAYASLEAPDFGPRYADAVVRYRRHLDALDLREVTHALVVMSARPAAPGGRYTVTLPVRSLSGVDADAVDGALAALELATADDPTLGRARVTAAPRARFVEERTTLDRTEPPTYSVRFERGALAVDQTLSEAAMVLLEALSQSPTVDAAAAVYAEACGVTPGEVAPQVQGFVREWLARGLLAPG